MSAARLLDQFSDKVSEAIDGLDDEVGVEEIRDAINWDELAKVVVREDPRIQKKLRDKVAKLIEEQIDTADSLGELINDDDFEFLEHLPEGSTVESIIASLFQPEGKLAKHLKERATELITEEITEASNLEDLFGDATFTWTEHLPQDFTFEAVMADVLASNSKVRKQLTDRLQALVCENIDALDDSDLPDWEVFRPLLNLEARIGECLTTPEMQALLTGRVHELLKQQIENSLDEEGLPDNWSELVDVQGEINRQLNDRSVRAELAGKLETAVRELMLGLPERESFQVDVGRKVELNLQFQNLVNRQISDLLENDKIVALLRGSIEEHLRADRRTGERLLNAFFDSVAQSLVEKMLKALAH